MSEGPVRHCPGCGQMLRFPADVGGVLMACPACGRRFAAPFRLAGPPDVSACRAVSSPFPPGPAAPGDQPVPPDPGPQAKTTAANTLAARVAALYASKS